MDPAEYGRMHELETGYWWFAGRRAIIHSLLRQHAGTTLPAAPISILDIGCGTGANLPMLHEVAGAGGTVVAMDFSHLALEFARRQTAVPGLHLVQGDGLTLPVPDGSCRMVTMLDVLEHLRDDRAALREVQRVLAPGGRFIFSVPAYQKLWSAHDEALHHFRRYENHALVSLLKASGFGAVRVSFAMSLMPPAAWFWRRCILPYQPRRPRDATRHSEGAVLPQLPGFANRLLIAYLQGEAAIIARRPLRFGTSLVGIAGKQWS